MQIIIKGPRHRLGDRQKNKESRDGFVKCSVTLTCNKTLQRTTEHTGLISENINERIIEAVHTRWNMEN